MKQSSQIQAIIFDLVGVLFTVDTKKALRTVGFREIAWYGLRKLSNPFDAGLRLLDKMRQEVPGQFQDSFTYRGILMPNIIGDWQRGSITSAAAYQSILDFFQYLSERNYFSNNNDRILYEKLLRIMLDNELCSEVLQPIESACQAVAELKANTKIKLFVLSNINHEIFNLLMELYPDFFAQFDGIVTSCQTSMLKPEPEIFNHLINQYALDPQHTIFIDDQMENLLTARSLGMHPLVCSKNTNLKKIFRRMQLI